MDTEDLCRRVMLDMMTSLIQYILLNLYLHLIKGLEYTTKRDRPGPLSLGNLFS